jgi:hypothetical protein
MTVRFDDVTIQVLIYISIIGGAYEPALLFRTDFPGLAFVAH